MALGLFWASAFFVVFLAVLSLDIMGFFTKKNQFPLEGRTVLLTGGSQGMGKGLAKLLSQKGANVILVARDSAKLQAALESIKPLARNPQSQRFHYISADITSEAENERVFAEATAWNNGNTPDIVWAHAGAAIPGLFVETKLETMRKQMDINYWAACYLAHTTLKEWLYPATPYATPVVTEKGKVKSELPKHFIITSSVIAFVNLAGYGPYGPAKTALRGLVDSLRSEMNLYNGARRAASSASPQQPPPFDVKIQAIFPGTIKSPGLELENKSKHPVTHLLESDDPVQTEDDAAAAALSGLENGGYIIATNWLGKLMRIGSISGSPRNNWIVDTFGQWLTSLVWLYVLPDLESKTWGWGKKNGMPVLGSTEGK